MNTVEQVFENANQILDQNVRTPIIFQKLAERGYQVTTQEEAEQILKLANDLGQAVANGEILPVPARELESDGTLSKHASARLDQDMFAFMDEPEIDMDQVDGTIKNASAASVICNLCA